MDKFKEPNQGSSARMEVVVQRAGDELVEKNQPEERLKGERGKSESKILIHKGANKQKTPIETDEVVQGSVLKHERGKVS